MQPKTINRYIGSSTIEDYASFDYYEGIRYCRNQAIPQITSGDPYKRMANFEGYIVTCGEVVIRVKIDMFPDIERITEVLAPPKQR